MSEWIDVKERLPEHEQWILIIGHNVGDASRYWSRPALMQWNGKEQRFDPDVDNIEGFYWSIEPVKLDEVTHWMPPPQEPKK